MFFINSEGTSVFLLISGSVGGYSFVFSTEHNCRKWHREDKARTPFLIESLAVKLKSK